MPIYEYDCPKCGRFETIQKVSDKALKSCPNCAKNGEKVAVTRAISQTSFHLKGSGWYKTDYGSASNGTGKTGGKKETTTTEKSDKAEPAKSDKADSGNKGPSGESSGSCGPGCGCH